MLETLAIDTWNRIELGWRYECSHGEETLTDINLLSLKMAGGPRVKIWKVAKPEEAKYGIDWHWYVHSRGTWRQYAIQAKILHQKDKYAQLRHLVGRVPPRIKQIDLLEAFAISRGAVPLYCFFNHSTGVTEAMHWHCGLPFEKQQLGCSLVHLRVVKKAHALRAPKGFGDLHKTPLSLPWRCLLDCSCRDPADSNKKHPFLFFFTDDSVVTDGPPFDWHQMDETSSLAPIYRDGENSVLQKRGFGGGKPIGFRRGMDSPHQTGGLQHDERLKQKQ